LAIELGINWWSTGAYSGWSRHAAKTVARVRRVHVKINVNPAPARRLHQEAFSSAPAMASSFRITSALWDKIHHFASFPQTGGEFVWPLGNVSITHHPGLTVAVATLLVSLQQMVQFGQNPGQGTLLRASQFLLGKFRV
jgi:hypothetical protein